MPTAQQVIAELKQYANPQSVEGMARFGIRPDNVLGISIPTLRKMAKELGRIIRWRWNCGMRVFTRRKYWLR